MTPDSVSAAYQELLAALAALDARWTEPGVVDDEQSRLDGYRWALSLVGVAADVFVFADPDRPRFTDIVGPYRKFNGDNPDAYYQFAPLDPRRTYRIRGRRGDAVYFSVTVYGTALDKVEDRVVDTDRIVGTVNDEQLSFDAQGGFEIVLGPARPAGWSGAFVELTPEAVCVITRDYLEDARRGRRVEWHVDAEEAPYAFRDSAARLAAAFRAAARFVRTYGQMSPIPITETNVVQPPFPVPTFTRGWAAGDASYAMGSFQLADGEALVIRGRSPQCRFWNLCVWNHFLTTYNYEYPEPVSINGGQLAYESDGSWTIVVAPRNPGHPNWVSTAGHTRGLLWFRWLCPERTPERPVAEVMGIENVPKPG